MNNLFHNYYKSTILIFTLIIFVMSCQSDTTKSDSPTKDATENESLAKDASENETPTSSPIETVSTETEIVEPTAIVEVLFPWVDKLKIRDASNLIGNTIATVDRKDALGFTGEQSEQPEEIVLRGVVYDEHWLKVITPGKEEGWVFGGAVQRKGEQKGTSPLRDKKFSFPHFGNFDLSTWKDLGTQTGGDEVDFSTTTYQKRNEILEVVTTDVGEFHYGYDYKLMDGQQKILKTRSFSFTAAPDGSTNEIVETVKDFMINKEFTRKQNLRAHFYQLNAKPKMVNGTWSELDLEVTSDN